MSNWNSPLNWGASTYIIWRVGAPAMVVRQPFRHLSAVKALIAACMMAMFFLAVPAFGYLIGTPTTWTTSVQVIFSFPQFPQNPAASLTLGLDGNFYGTSFNGGVYGCGAVYQVTSAGVVTPLYSFTGGSDGARPQAALTLGPDGNFYGTTAYGGVDGLDGDGTVFQVTTNGALTTLYTFTQYGFASVNGSSAPVNSDGMIPEGLALGPNGNFYGIATQAGSNSFGTVFEVTTNGAFNALYSFTGGADGAYPQTGLALGPDGNFYGVAQQGGTNGFGTVFEMTTNGVLTPLYSFTGGNDGANPGGQLALGPDGNFYGTTQNGGTNGFGGVFDISTNGVLTPLYSFTGGNDGANPQAGLVRAVDGNMYGATQYGGGTNNSGTVFKITTNAVFTVLYSFTGGNDGANPIAALVPGPDGNLEGMTINGGVTGGGAVYEMSTNGLFTSVAGFANGYGANPDAGLAVGPDGNLYGTTEYGGGANDGAVFGITANGVITTRASFAGTNGLNPQAGVTFGPGGNLYGTAYLGGTDNDGAVFELTTNGAPATIYSFTAGADGALPLASLTVAPDGSLYGTASTNGGFGQGVVFQLNPTNNLLTPLAGFNGANGANPQAGLTIGPDGNFYGTTYSGGSSNLGTIFEVTTNGAFATLYSFTGSGNIGANPMGGLTVGPDGNFYGTTYQGGTNGNGTVFQFSTNHMLATLYSFSAETSYYWYLLNSDGANPLGNLVVGPDGNLYGVTQTGGIAAGGAAFAITTGGVLTPVAYFANGTDPQAGLTLGPDGNFYGTTFNGGVDWLGEVYRLNLQPEFSQEPSAQIVASGAPVTFSVNLFGIGPFSFQWLSNNIPIAGATNQTLTLPNAAAGAAATYSVNVSNFWGQAASSTSSVTVYSIAGTANGTLTLNFISPPNGTTLIWATTNLLNPNWIPVYTNTATAPDGTWQFTDIPTCPERFYQFSTQ